jgi:hypothetical protein
MKKIILALFVVLLAAMPLAAEAQVKKKKKKKEEPNPIAFLLGIFSTANCVIGCGTAASVTVTTIFIPREERLVTVVTKNSSAGGAFLAGAALCSALWPFINLALGGKEPTSEEALLNTVSCWVPGLGLVLYLQQQQGAT